MQRKSTTIEELPPTNKYSVAEIFVIDDEQIVVDTLSYFLQSAGFTRVHGFVDSFEAVAQMRIVRPDVVFTDIGMPKFSGNTVAKIVKNFPHLRTVPIIAITADESDETSRSIIEDGALSVLIKPVTKETLVQRTIQAIDQALEQVGISNWAEQAEQHARQSNQENLALPTESAQERQQRRRNSFRT